VTVASFDLLVVGDCNPDLVIRGGDVEPAFGQAERLVEKAELTIGASAAIVACGAARLGLRTALVAAVGDDLFGRFMLDALAERDVDTRGCVIDPARPTGLTVVLSRPGDRAILTAPGAIGALRADLVDRDLLRSARHVHVASYFLQPALQQDVPALFEEARAAGATTSLDVNWDPAERWNSGIRAALGATDVFFPNAMEARRVAGLDDVDAAVAMLATWGPVVAAKLGASGGLARRGKEVVRAPALDVDAVDTTGAGDGFDAGFIAGHLAGWSLERTLALACACGSLTTRAPGGTAGQPTMEEALATLDAQGAASAGDGR
jgi:sugar/nucleoside kinase (ribokinase family)